MVDRVKGNATGVLPVVGCVLESSGAIGPPAAADSERPLTIRHPLAGINVRRSDADEVKVGRGVLPAIRLGHLAGPDARFAVVSDARGTGRSCSSGVGGIAAQTQSLSASTAQYAHLPSWMVTEGRAAAALLAA